jgi:hypothetical protein
VSLERAKSTGANYFFPTFSGPQRLQGI